jgi:hypothetical protein
MFETMTNGPNHSPPIIVLVGERAEAVFLWRIYVTAVGVNFSWLRLYT